MTTKTEMVSVPREWLNRVSLLQISLDELQDQAAELLAAPAEDFRAVVDEPAAWANDQQLLLCSRSPREECEGNMLIHDLPRNVAGSALETSYCNTPLYRRPQRKLEMADVVKAHLDIPGCPVLTSNQCHALALKLNEKLNPQ